MKSRRLLFVLGLVFVLGWIGFIPAQAHSMLVLSIPAPNSSLMKPPSQVELYFSGTINLPSSQIKVVDSNGKQVDKGDKHLDPLYFTHLVVSLPTLEAGIYQVIWKAISATDGHLTNGSFYFAVGKLPADLMVPISSQSSLPGNSLPIADMLVKGILYLSASVLLGTLLFTHLVWAPSLRKANLADEVAHPYERFSKRLILVALLTLTLANLVSLMVQAGLARGVLLAWPWQPEFLTVLSSTWVGSVGIFRFEIAIVLAFLLLRPPNYWNRWAGLAFCLFLLLTFSLESHAAGRLRPFLPVLVDWLHLLAVSVWVGGLFAFLGGMLLIRRLAPEARTRLTSILIPHFTNVALASVGVLVLTGLYSAFLEVGRPEALWSTIYGQALVVKLVIAVPMLGLGAVHLFFTTPAVRQAASQPEGSARLVIGFQRLLTLEAILGILILLWVGAFTSLPPSSLTPLSAEGGRVVQMQEAPARMGFETASIPPDWG